MHCEARTPRAIPTLAAAAASAAAELATRTYTARRGTVNARAGLLVRALALVPVGNKQHGHFDVDALLTSDVEVVEQRAEPVLSDRYVCLAEGLYLTVAWQWRWV